MNVAEMNFDGWNLHSGNRISKGVGVVSVGSWVKDDSVGPFSGFMEQIDELAFVVGLMDFELATASFGKSSELGIELIQGHRSIDFGFPFSEEIEVGAVENE
jgi:hypothetical protein